MSTTAEHTGLDLPCLEQLARRTGEFRTFRCSLFAPSDSKAGSHPTGSATCCIGCPPKMLSRLQSSMRLRAQRRKPDRAVSQVALMIVLEEWMSDAGSRDMTRMFKVADEVPARQTSRPAEYTKHLM